MNRPTFAVLFASSLCAVQWLAAPVQGQPEPTMLPLPLHGLPFAELDLTAEQKTQIRQILKASHQKAAPYHAQLRKIGQETHSQIKAVLTPEQNQQLKDLHGEHDRLIAAP